MKVKIISCSRPSFWYAGFVGQTFTVERDIFFDEHDKVYKYEVKPTKTTDVLYLININDCKAIAE